MPAVIDPTDPANGSFIQGDAAGDQAGYSVSFAGDVNGDGLGDFILGAPQGDDGGNDAGEAYLIFGKAGGLGPIDLSSLGAADGFIIQGDAAGDQAGFDVAGAGDVNDDGFDDLIVAALTGDDGGSNAGEAYVIFGKAGPFGPVDLTGLAPADGFIIQGDTSEGRLGFSVASAGDINDDGYADVVVSAHQNPEISYVVYGKASGFGTLDLSFFSAADGFVVLNAGSSAAPAGDVNGDGIDDLVIGSGSAPYGGKAYVIFGQAGSLPSIDVDNLAPGEAWVIQSGSNNWAGRLGDSVASAGDINGDGFDDLIVGAPGWAKFDRTGQAFVIFGKASGFDTVNITSLDEGEGFAVRGIEAGDRAGTSVSSAGDFNGDGYVDFIVGAPMNDPEFLFGARPGAAYVIFGEGTGYRDVDLADLSRIDGFVIQGPPSTDAFGFSVSYAGDVNGDGYDDVFVGAPDNGAGGMGAGSAYIVYGRASHAAIIGTPGDDQLVGTADDDIIRGLDGDDKINGGGGDDRLEGGDGDDTYFISDDLVIEAPGGGNDTIVTNVSYRLAAGQEIELLRTYGSATTAAINLTGNEFANALVGNAAANVLNGKGGADIMWGYAGDDTYFVDHAADSVTEGGGGGTDLVITNVSYMLAAGQQVEQLTTYGSATTAAIDLTGNEFANALVGNAAANVLNGKGGADNMWGYRGNDIYYVDQAADSVTEAANGGSDWVITSASFALGAGQYVELLTTYGSATTNAINLTGNEFDDTIVGNAAANSIDGRGGIDVMWGYAGNDTYFVDNAGDSVTEAAGGGTDLVVTNVSYTLAAGQQVEQLTTHGSATTAAIDLTGNEFANTLVGNAAANVLNGKGGADAMYGYAGNDTYYVDSALDTVVEAAGGGSDLVITNVSYALAAGQEVEQLTTYGSATTNAINLTGNEFANTILGNAAANQLDGKAGADAMYGYAGNDTYYVDNAGDSVTEAAGGGSDTVFANASFALGAGQQVELLTTFGSATTNAINLTGNELANTIVGNNGANSIDGKGGIDAMYGYAGNDTYFIDNAADSVTEAAGGGSDTVVTSVSYTLAAGQEIETLTTYGSSIALGIDLTGNAIANTIVGDDGDNSIDGKGGGDILYGYAGLDLFAFTTALGAGNVDTLGDFQGGLDKMLLENDVFTGLAQGNLPAGAFNTGSSAQDADDRIIYDTATGALYFDADGTGGAAAVQFATLNPGLALAASDFVLI